MRNSSLFNSIECVVSPDSPAEFIILFHKFSLLLQKKMQLTKEGKIHYRFYMVLSNSQELSSYVATFLNTNADGSVTITDEAKLLSEGIDRLVFTSALSDDSALCHEIRVLIRKIGVARGVHSASIYELYKAIGEGEVRGFSVPAMNIRMMNYDFSRAIFDE